MLVAGTAAAQRKDMVNYSLFSDAVAGTGYGVLIGDSFTNLPAASVRVAEIAGALDGLSIFVDLVGSVGTTNGVLTIALAASQDGINFTSQTNFFVIRPPVAGTARTCWITNIPASALVGVGYLKIQQIASTNTSAYFITNITYRGLLTR